MNTKTLSTLLFVLAILLLPASAAAQLTITPTMSGQNTVTTATSTAATTTTTPASSASCLDLVINLTEGMSGSAVTSLQNFLKQQGHFTHPQATGYFGPLTTSAVQLFQKAQGTVLNGAPSTTGFGAVGPKTRQTIKDLTCIGGSGANGGGLSTDGTNPGSGSFFGYDLDALLNSYKPDFNYDVSSAYDFDSSYALDDEYELDFNYEVDMDYDLDFDFDADLDYDSDFEYELDFGGYGEDNVKVVFAAQATTSVFMATMNPIEVSSRNAVLQWDSDNADVCELSGDFPERSMFVPLKGQATIYLVNPSYTVPKTEDTSKPAFGFRLTCSVDETYGASASAILLLHIKE